MFEDFSILKCVCCRVSAKLLVHFEVDRKPEVSADEESGREAVELNEDLRGPLQILASSVSMSGPS